MFISNNPKSVELSSPKHSRSSFKFADEIREIEQEIALHGRLIIDLKIKRNSRLPISQLPIEILCTILRRAQDAWTTSPSIYDSQDNLRWITLSHVCKLWRYAALSDPYLWRRPPLDFNHRRWANIMLERSRMGGLHLAINHRSDLQQDFLSTLSSHSPRVEELSILGLSRGSMEELFRTVGVTHMPALQKLSIDGQEYSPFPSVIGLPLHPDPEILKNHFIGSANLRHLSLTAVVVDWTSGIFSSLTNLSIMKLSDVARPSPSEFRDVLAMMPQLTSLLLHDALPRANILSTTSHQRVPLPALQRLITLSSASECEFLWENISPSNNLNLVDITCGAGYDSDTASSLPTFLAAIYAADSTGHLERNTRCLFVSAADLTFKKLLICVTNQLSKSLDNGDVSTPPVQSADQNFKFNMDLQGFSASRTYRDQPGDIIFTDFFNSMRWSRLCELNVIGLPMSQNSFPEVFCRTFGSLVGVQTVTTGQRHSSPLVEALLAGLEDDTAIPPTSILFPGLRHLRFYGVSFDGLQRDPVLGCIGLDYDRLRHCLLNRRARNVRIIEISIFGCWGFNGERLRGLEEIGVSVNWDGHGVN